MPALADTTILNVSYDPTRELYKAYDAAFAAYWKDKTGETVTIEQSHGGSGAQARAVIDGLAADVVTLALAADIDAIAKKSGKIAADWQKRLPEQLRPLHLDHRLPRPQGQSQGHQGLGRPRQAGHPGDHAQSRRPRAARAGTISPPGPMPTRSSAATTPRSASSSATSTSNVPVLDTGARGSTTTFAQRGIGDVLLAWENEAFLSLKELGADKFEIVVPSLSIKAEPPVAVVDGNVDAKGTRKVAEAYLDYLYSDAGPEDHRQELLPAGQAGSRRSGGSEAFPGAEAGRPSTIRFSAAGRRCSHPLRRWWYLRPDLQAGTVI